MINFTPEIPFLAETVTPLLYWFRANARTLPWRSDPTPYHVWLSEIMLQQTRVEAVKPYYLRFLATFPDIASLANADDEVLSKLWQGLGYYSRARNLKKCAGQIMTQYGGEMPQTIPQLLTLAGIGPYTAGAISSIAFGNPTPAVDGNVLRVISRILASRSDITAEETKTAISSALAVIYPPGQCASFTQALMELGAIVCLPNGAPLCEACPLSDLCKAKALGCWSEIPHKPPKKPRKAVDRTVFLLRYNNRYALVKRPAKGVLAGLWEFVCADQNTPKERTLLEAFGSTAKKIGTCKHIFTHLEWHMTGYFTEVPEPLPSFVWATVEEIDRSYAVPSAYRYFLDYLHQS